jgi:hypothetical protein
MKIKDLVELLLAYDNDDEIEIEVYETNSGKYIDTSAAISVVEEDVWVPTLRIDAEAGKFKPFL